jgi:formate hydrogenlyase subunit 3/multisubunit Na+/H+ antiporter MnhD subunit
VLLIFTVITPVIGWITYKKKYRKIRGLYAFLSFSVTAYFLYELYTEVSKEGSLQSFSLPFEACLKIDMLSVFMALTYVMIGLLAAFYSIKYMERDT